MYKFSKRSLNKLDTVWEPLQALAHRVIDRSEIDFGIISGLRTAEEQHALYEIGRKKELDRKPVTYRDGYKKKSYHQTGMALDFAVYVGRKITWTDTDKYVEVGKLFKEEFEKMQSEGIMPEDAQLIHGADWSKFKDYPHIEIRL